MSISKLQEIFAALPYADTWSLQLLRVKTSKRSGTIYTGREITFTPPGKLNEFVSEISSRYIDSSSGILQSFLEVMNYDGSSIDKTVYKLQAESELISDEYSALIAAVATPDVETNPLEFRAQAYLLKGTITLDGMPYPVKLISMQNPVTTLKHI